jgi:lysophospholipase L1-like esterase
VEFILFGANDSCIPLPTNDQHVKLEKFSENLTKIIQHPLIQAHKPKIWLVAPPPLDEIRITELDLAWGHPAATRQAKVSASYSEAVRKVAVAQGVGLVDLWKGIMDYAIAKTPGFKLKSPEGPFLGDPESGERGYLEHLLPDGLHLSGESYKFFFDLVKDLVSEDWAGTPDEERVGYVLPDWRDAPKLED